MKTFLQILTGGIFLVIGYRFVDDDLRPEFIGGGALLILSLILVDGVHYIVSNRKRLWLIFRTKIILASKGEYIRFSMSYQYRIKVKNHYLLVKNSNPQWNFYQHVGGKYKRLDETKKVLADFGCTDDLKMKTDGLKKGDLAVFVPAEYAIEFIDWFNTKRGREISHWREFYEELVYGKASVLSKEKFPYVQYSFVGSVITPLKKAHGWNCWEILLYDVLDLLPNADQEKELETLLQNGDTDYIKWATPALINSLGHDENLMETRYKIGEHAKWVLNMKWSKP